MAVAICSVMYCHYIILKKTMWWHPVTEYKIMSPYQFPQISMFQYLIILALFEAAFAKVASLHSAFA